MRDVDDIHEHLKNLVEASTMRWTYAIFWRCSSHPSVLDFHVGYYKGTAKCKAFRIFGSSVTVTEEVTDAEWFFKISMAQSFANTEDLPGYAFFCSNPVWVTAADSDGSKWERTKWGHEFGIQTLLFIPFSKKGVLEIGSSEIVPYDLEVIQKIAVLVHPIGLPHFPVKHWALLRQSRNDESLHERADKELRNHGIDSFYKQLRGKEKISDTKFSWPLLTESSDRGTDRTFSYSHEYSGPS
ncbi:transcription factor MYC2-like [Abrus precatorius]|uniref:Transcription factor n=1 Tax=Abrus precatorius TaxID=3816 RepID=A0A8B8JSZ0_ABRPR|nr:transcription factor MYC2-like [Abrus precatorius]